VRLTGELRECGATCNAHCLVAKAGVTYEGRTAGNAETDDADAVTVDLTNTAAYTSGGLCQGQAIGCGSGTSCLFGNMTVRDLRLYNAPGGQYTCMYLQPSGASAGLTFDKVHFDICRGGGSSSNIIGQETCGGAGSGGCTRLTSNVTLTDVEVNDHIGHGMMIGGVDGLTVTRGHFHHNGEGFCRTTNTNVGCTGTNTCPGGDCSSDDGMVIGGGIHFTVTAPSSITTVRMASTCAAQERRMTFVPRPRMTG